MGWAVCAFFLQWVTPAALSAVYVYSGIVQKAVLLEVLGGFLFGFVVLHACACQLFERLFTMLCQTRAVAPI